MTTDFSKFEKSIINQFQHQFGQLKIKYFNNTTHSNSTLFSLKPLNAVAFTQLQSISEIVGTPTKGQDKQFIDRLCRYAEGLLLLLQNNEECRLSWVGGGVRHQIENTNVGNYRILLAEQKKLSLLIDQCRYGIVDKFEFVDFINRKGKQIFEDKQILLDLKIVKEIWLLLGPQNYDHVELLGEDGYFQQLKAVGQRLIMYKNIAKDYIDNHLSWSELQQICGEMMREDHSLLSGLRVSKLIKYILVFCQQRQRLFRCLKQRIIKLNNSFIGSIIKNYYVGFQLKKVIQLMSLKLSVIEEKLLYILIEQRQSKIDRKLMIDKVNGNSDKKQNKKAEQLECELMTIQSIFNEIYEYMTGRNQYFFVYFFRGKENKRAIQLLNIQNKITNLYKINSNRCYADLMIKHYQIRQYRQERKKYLQQKSRQLQQLINQLEKGDDGQFRYIFQQIQRLAIFYDCFLDDQDWQTVLIRIQNKLLSVYLPERTRNNGYRHYLQKKQDDAEINSLKSSRVFRQYVFEDSITEIKNKNSSLASSRAHKQEGEMMDRNQQYEQGLRYISSLSPAFGQQLMDAVNFRVYILLKLTKRIEKCLELTPYSQQPLNLQLTRLLQNLRMIPNIILTEINEQKLNLIFYPKINAGLFSFFRSTLKKHRQTIIRIEEQINNDPIKGNAIDDGIRLFLKERAKFIHVLLMNSQKLQNIAYTVEQVMKKKESFAIETAESQDRFLKLLIAQKQLRADQSSLLDGMSKKLISYRGIEFLSSFMIPLMIKSLSFPFELDHNNNADANTLGCLLQLCQKCKSEVKQSDNYIDTMISMIQGRGRNGINQVIADCKVKLKEFRSNLSILLQNCQYYKGIDIQGVSKQLLKIDEFLLICVNGRSLSEEIMDERSRRFLRIVQSINS